MRLYEAIADLVKDRSLTYRQITQLLNQRRTWVPADGSFVTTVGVREAVRRRGDLFCVDRTCVPNRICAKEEAD